LQNVIHTKNLRLITCSNSLILIDGTGTGLPGKN